MKKQNKKSKEFKLPMKFNPGLQKYEPVLPIRKKGKPLKMNKVGLGWLILIIILIIFMIALFLFADKIFDLFNIKS